MICFYAAKLHQPTVFHASGLLNGNIAGQPQRPAAPHKRLQCVIYFIRRDIGHRIDQDFHRFGQFAQFAVRQHGEIRA